MASLDFTLPTSLGQISKTHIAAAIIPLIAAIPYLLLKFPSPVRPPKVHPGLAGLPGPDDELRKRLKAIYPENFYEGGAYADLPFGKLRYYVVGGEFYPKLVLICGISIPSPIWKDVIPILAAHFRILVFDHYGRGYSEAPETEYDTMFYTLEVALLMQHLGWEKAHIAGMSMGGPIACAFAVNFPKLVDGKVALFAPAGLMQSILRRLYKPGGATPLGEEIIKLQQVVLPYHIAAVASSIRDGPLRELDYAYAKLGKSDVKVLVVWGTADTVVPYSLATQVLTHIPRAKLITIAGAGHDLLLTHAEEVGTALTDFLR
ncbi:hypothetical protein FRC04_000344 [Tulasnella sp. 424]|nr:hypothetical protein FRC04_000344 [Tulasnella sp. 424]KAG8957826.1 hypothetical protein FRC05_009566 [Tulasnella sp. 425]